MLLKQMLGGYGSVLDGQLVTKATFGYNPNLKSRPYDPAKAKALLAEAGFPKGFENKINTLSGRYLSDVDIANAVAGMMSAVGVQDQRQRRRGRGVVPARPVARAGADVPGRAGSASATPTSTPSGTPTRASATTGRNAEFDKLWLEARSTMDEAARLKAYNRMMEIMHEEVPLDLPVRPAAHLRPQREGLRLAALARPAAAPARRVSGEGDGASASSAAALPPAHGRALKRLTPAGSRASRTCATSCGACCWCRCPLIFVIAFVFVVLRLTGDPVAIYLGLDATPEQEAVLRAELHLDKPVPVQFGYFLLDLLHGDFGTSIQFKRPAMEVVHRAAGLDALQLLSLGLLLAIVLGVLGGVACAVWKDKVPDFVISVLAVVGQSMPSFWLGILLIQLFALDLQWLPTSGQGGWEHLVLPVVTLATFLVPNFILVMRVSVLETAREQFVVTRARRGAGPRGRCGGTSCPTPSTRW